MPGGFEFMKGKFPEIAEDGQKAENYIFTDNAACMLYISRVFDGAVKTVCRLNNISLKSEDRERNLSDLIDELQQKKIVRGNILRIMHNMRVFRNKNAHNEETSQKDSLNLLEQARTLCEWLMKNYGKDDPVSKKKKNLSHIKISLIGLMSEYGRNPVSAKKKYEGRPMTITGGRVLKVKRSEYGEDAFIVSLVSSPVNNSALMSTVYKADCYFPLKFESQLSTLTPGKNFSTTGTWQGGKLKNCVWKAEGKRRNIFTRRDSEYGEPSLMQRILTILFIIAVVLWIIFGRD